MIKDFIGLSEIEIFGQKYVIEECIRSSRLSDVYSVKQQGTELEYILKILSPKEESADGSMVPVEKESNKYYAFKNAFQKEIKITKKVSDNFYKIFGNKESFVFFDSIEENDFLLLKYFKMDTLETYIESCMASQQKYDKENIIFLLTRSVYRLHNYGILHGDISPDNVLIGDDGNKIVIIDYGNTYTNQTSPFFYKRFYSAPELAEKFCCLGRCTDIYSLGMTIRYILTGLQPEKAWDRMIDSNLKNVYYRWLLKNCLQRRPQKRFQSCLLIYITLYIYKYRKRVFILGIVFFIVLIFLLNCHFYRDKEGQRIPPEVSDVYTAEKMSYKGDDRFEYEIVDNKVCITNSSVSVTDVVIPKDINGVPVVAIQGININVTNVMISDGVERIDDYAFQNCQYLQRVQIPESINYISEYAFINCGKLEEFDISLENKFYKLYDNKLIQTSDNKIIYEIK